LIANNWAALKPTSVHPVEEVPAMPPGADGWRRQRFGLPVEREGMIWIDPFEGRIDQKSVEKSANTPEFWAEGTQNPTENTGSQPRVASSMTEKGCLSGEFHVSFASNKDGKRDSQSY
jgi:hypothetical protein